MVGAVTVIRFAIVIFFSAIAMAISAYVIGYRQGFETGRKEEKAYYQKILEEQYGCKIINKE